MKFNGYDAPLYSYKMVDFAQGKKKSPTAIKWSGSVDCCPDDHEAFRKVDLQIKISSNQASYATQLDRKISGIIGIVIAVKYVRGLVKK